MKKDNSFKLLSKDVMHPIAPFNFEGTVFKPSHFPTPENKYCHGKFWTTMRFGMDVFGILLVNTGTVQNPSVEVSIYGISDYCNDMIQEVYSEIEWRFGFNEDLNPFITYCSNDKVLMPIINKWKGMRIKCCQSLYEFLMIVVVLQNATVRRSSQMLQNMFDSYGGVAKFNGNMLQVFWHPESIVAAGESSLRDIKLGYRAKTIVRISDQFVKKNYDEKKMRTWTYEKLREQILSLYGIGPASVWYILFEVFRKYDSLETISPWEQKIYSKLIYDKDDVSVPEIMHDLTERWGEWRMLGAHYLFEDLFWSYKAGKAKWLEKFIRL